MARLWYNGVDITDEVEINLLDVSDDCGDAVDAIDSILVNSKNQWSGWSPQKGDLLRVTNGGYSSGDMHIDQIVQDDGTLALGAVSVPPDGKTKRTCAWEMITLHALCAEKAARYGMTAEYYGVRPHSYRRIDQAGQGDFAFLQQRCTLEGCTMKVSGKKLIVYADDYMEQLAPVKTIDAGGFYGNPSFDSSSAKTYGACTVSWGSYAARADDPNVRGAELHVNDVEVYSLGEAQRFAENLLRSRNKHEVSALFPLTLDTSITAGNVVAITGTGMSDGRYFIENARHRCAEGISVFRAHRIREV